MSPQIERLRSLAADLPGVDRFDLLNFISPHSLRHEFVPDDFDRQWIDCFVTTSEKFGVWKNTAPAWYLHCSGPPRSGKVGYSHKTTCLAALARHLQQGQEPSQRNNAAVVTLFLDSYEFEQQKALPLVSPLEVILRAILRQLVEHLLPSLGRTTGTQDMDAAQLRKLVKTSAHCFSDTYVLVDNVHEIPVLSEEEIFLELRNLDIRSVMFTGLPLNRFSDGIMETSCDCCGETKKLWAECESCNCCYCSQCHENKPKCCKNMKDVLAVVELPLQAELVTEDYVRLALSGSGLSLDPQQEQNAATDILEERWNSLPLTRLALNDFLERPELEEFGRTRDRLSLSTLRFFNLALWRVKSQRSQHDVDLGLAVLAIVSLAGPGTLGFYALLGILSRVCQHLGNPQLPGEGLNRARISRVTQGWLHIAGPPKLGQDGLAELFHPQAHTYLNEECSGFHAAVLGEKGRDLALICLEALSEAAPDFEDFQGQSEDVSGDNPERALLRYALENWGRHFGQYSSEATRVAACKFLNQYQDSLVLKRFHRKTSSNSSSTGRTAVGHSLHLLAEFGLDQLVDQVARGPADLNVVDATTGLTPAMVACNADSTAFVRKLLCREDPPNCHPSDRAGSRADFSRQCKKGNTALWYAIQTRRTKTVRQILHQQGSLLVNLQDKQGKTPLMLAVDQNNKHMYDDILQLLLDTEGLKLDISDNFGQNALHIAAMRVDHSVLEITLKQTAGRRIINKREDNHLKRTALMVLLSERFQMDERLEAVKILIKYGADTSLSDAKGRTVLHYAATSNAFSRVLGEILKTKVDVSAKDGQQVSALQVARAYGAEQVIKMLCEKQSNMGRSDKLSGATSAPPKQQGAKPPSSAKELQMYQVSKLTTAAEGGYSLQKDPIISLSVLLRHTELHSAVCSASLDTVQSLLSQTTDPTVDPNDRTTDGDTALHLAIQALADAGRDCREDDCIALESIIRILLGRTDLSAENDLNEKTIDLAARLIPDKHSILLDIIEATMESKVDVRPIRILDPQACLRSALTGERCRSPQLIEVLLEAGASVFQTIYNYEMKLPREAAEERKLGNDVVDMLVKWEEAIEAF